MPRIKLTASRGHSVCRAVVSPVDLVLAVAVDAGVAEALVDLREADGVVVAVRTQAGEAVDAVHASAAVVAGVDGALIDVDVTHGACAEPTKSHTTGCVHHPQLCVLAIFTAKIRTDREATPNRFALVFVSFARALTFIRAIRLTPKERPFEATFLFPILLHLQKCHLKHSAVEKAHEHMQKT